LSHRVQLDPSDSTFVTSSNISVPYGDEEQLTIGEGELNNDPPPPSSSLCIWKDRAVIGWENEVWISKPTVEGIATTWTGFQRIKVPAVSGKVTGVGVAGVNLAVLTPDALWRLYGTPPAANGQGAALSDIERVVSDTGCVSERSICETGAGLMFQARRAIYIWDGGAQPAPIGDPILDEMETYPVVTTAEQFDGESLIAVGLTDNEAGEYAVFDLRRGVWTIWPVGLGTTTSYYPMSGIVVNGTHYYVDGGGLVHKRAADYKHDSDDPSFIVTTPWLKPHGINGMWRARRLLTLGEGIDDHSMVCEIGYDYSPDYTDTIRLTVAQMAATSGYSDARIQTRTKLPREPVNSIRFRFTMTVDTAATTAPVRFHGIRLEYARKQSALIPGSSDAMRYVVPS